jgi:hypothetical protein
MPDIFSPEALRKRVQDLPPEQGGIGVVVQPGDIGVQGAVSKQIGKGWSVAATGSWFKAKGYQAAAWLGWKGTP